MSYFVLARKYRPQSFEDLIGQEPVAKTLVNALSQGKVAHAYLFSGPRGTGKTTTARLLARALNCQKGPTPKPCGDCPSCKEILTGSSVEDVLEIDAASNRGIDDIRNLRENVKYAPARSRFRIYIIDEAHQITKEGFNALLKTLEEPPSYTVFMLATTELQKMPATILSRCQRFGLRPIASHAMTDRLEAISKKESLKIDRPALEEITRAAGGSVRDALSLLDQVVVFAPQGASREAVRDLLGLLPREVIRSFTETLRGGDLKKIVLEVVGYIEKGGDLSQLARDLQERYHLVLQAKAGLTDFPGEDAAELKGQAENYSFNELEKNIRLLGRCQEEMKRSPSPQAVFQVFCLRLAQPGVDTQLLLKRIETLEQALSGKAPAPALAPAPASAPAVKPPVPAAEIKPPTTAAPPPAAKPPEIKPAVPAAEVKPPSPVGPPPAVKPVVPAIELKSPAPVAPPPPAIKPSIPTTPPPAAKPPEIKPAVPAAEVKPLSPVGPPPAVKPPILTTPPPPITKPPEIKPAVPAAEVKPPSPVGPPPAMKPPILATPPPSVPAAPPPVAKPPEIKPAVPTAEVKPLSPVGPPPAVKPPVPAAEIKPPTPAAPPPAAKPPEVKPPAPAAPAPAPVSKGITEEDLKINWSFILQELQQVRPSLAVCIEEASVRVTPEGAVELAFAKGFSMEEAKKKQDLIAAAIWDRIGKKPVLSFVTGAKPPPSREKPGISQAGGVFRVEEVVDEKLNPAKAPPSKESFVVKGEASPADQPELEKDPWVKKVLGHFQGDLEPGEPDSKKP